MTNATNAQEATNWPRTPVSSEYSLISVSPGLKDGIIDQGKWDSEADVNPLELCVGPSSSDGILDQIGFQ